MSFVCEDGYIGRYPASCREKEKTAIRKWWLLKFRINGNLQMNLGVIHVRNKNLIEKYKGKKIMLKVEIMK